jgi:hypothetical protein
MTRDSGPRDRQCLGELTRCRFAIAQNAQHDTTTRVGEGLQHAHPSCECTEYGT